MKSSAIFYVIVTTIVLIMVTIMSALNYPFHWVYYATVIGQGLVIIMVYKVLTDKYSTDKTFEHFYEDRPIEPIKIPVKNDSLIDKKKKTK